MSYSSGGPPWTGAISALLDQASAVMSPEEGRTCGTDDDAESARGTYAAANGGESLTAIAARVCPVTGAAVPSAPVGLSRLRQQAHELLAGLFGGHWAQPGRLAAVGSPGDQLRRQAHELVETLLATFDGSRPGSPHAADDRVPLLRGPAPVQAGQSTRVGFRVANEEGTPSDVTLYCTDFISDSGHEIPAVRVAVSPRRATIAAHGSADFDIDVSVPPQTPPGYYSGLIQAMGNRYVKAVLMVQVT